MTHSEHAPTTSDTPVHPPGFRPRRGLNWAFLGLLYTSYYMCRYNFSIANKSISNEFGFNASQMGAIITTNLLAYAFGQIINGLLTDRIGGKKAMLIGAAGTIVMNVAFGAASFAGTLGLFIALWGLNGYVQAFGSPGMVKINTAWFSHRERGRFAGIYGFMINLGRFFIFQLGPGLLAGTLFWGAVTFAPLHWRWLFWAPSIICAVVAVFMAFVVKQTPEEAGFHHMSPASKAPHPAFPASTKPRPASTRSAPLSTRSSSPSSPTPASGSPPSPTPAPAPSARPSTSGSPAT